MCLYNPDMALLTDCGEFAARCTDHRQLANFAAPSQVKQRQSYDTDLLV